jgi:Ca2+:H+ antiporter
VTDSPAAVNWLPRWTLLVPAAALIVVAPLLSGVLPVDAAAILTLAALMLVATVFASVHHAEVVALRIGEPFGSIVLAMAVTVIEVGLIVSIMLAGGRGSAELARDTVFATIMIVLNGIVGLCLLAGGARHREQTFTTDSATAALSVLSTLAIVTLVVPEFTTTAPGPVYAPVQQLGIGFVSIVLYAVFLFVQTVRHREYFLPAETDTTAGLATAPSRRIALTSLVLLVLSLLMVVLLAKTLSGPLERAVAATQLPMSFVGVIVAGIVLLPEAIAAMKAARANHLQISLNLALGSALATTALTIPIVGAVALYLTRPLVLGLDPTSMVLLLLTLFISTITLATGRTTILQGAVHVAIFVIFLLLSMLP